MDIIDDQIKQRLISLQDGISHSNAETVSDSLKALDALYKTNRHEIDPQLSHYLKNRSYAKALAFLEGESNIPKGRCGGRTEF